MFLVRGGRGEGAGALSYQEIRTAAEEGEKTFDQRQPFAET